MAIKQRILEAHVKNLWKAVFELQDLTVKLSSDLMRLDIENELLKKQVEALKEKLSEK